MVRADVWLFGSMFLNLLPSIIDGGRLLWKTVDMDYMVPHNTLISVCVVFEGLLAMPECWVSIASLA